MKAKFPGADFYFATWSQYEKTFRNIFADELCEFFPEPVLHYHPYRDIAPEDHVSSYYQLTVNWAQQGGHARMEWTSHHTKQILIHAWLTARIKDGYDVIVRTRFDAFISRQASFAAYLEDTFRTGRANCFGATRPNAFDAVTEIDTGSGMHQVWMLDHVIIHPAAAIDAEAVDTLHRDKKLHAAEYGWYQVIGRQCGHRNHTGWVNPDHSVLPKYFA